MAQRPTSDFDIDPNITSGTDLANILNRFQDAIDSGNSGASRPAYLAAGGMWVKEGNPMRLYLYDGTKDIELYNTTDGLVGASQWKDNGNDIYYDGGNVGIGTTPTATTKLKVSLASESEMIRIDNEISGRFLAIGLEDNQDAYIWNSNNNVTGSLRFMNGPNSGTPRMHIDASGRVGIGGEPSRSAEEIAKEAKDTLARWKSTFDERLKAEPKSDKKAITLEITRDEFDTLPTEKALVERLQERDIGGGNAKLQVAGGGYFSGAVNSGEVDVTGDGYFSGEVHADDFLRNGVPVPTAKDLIETLSTLREATRDETTLEGLRDALSDAIGGLIQKFEAQISTTES